MVAQGFGREALRGAREGVRRNVARNNNNNKKGRVVVVVEVVAVVVADEGEGEKGEGAGGGGGWQAVMWCGDLLVPMCSNHQDPFRFYGSVMSGVCSETPTQP